MDKQQTLIKVLSIGDSQVGKSCLIKRFCEGRFVSRYITTIGVDYGVKKMTISGKKIAINFFDLSGDDQYGQISDEFIKDAQVKNYIINNNEKGILLVCDLTDKETFNNLNRWEKKLKNNDLLDKQSVIILVGNKNDLPNKQVKKENLEQYAKKKGMECFLTSANSGENVNELFDALFKKVVEQNEAIYKSFT